MSASTPYPGLRPFRRDETDIFFGREQQTDQLLQKLDSTRFLAVVGASGCGKSSLVRAGLISSLEGGFVLSAGPHWQIADMRPGNHPMQRLAGALLRALNPKKRDDPIARAFIHSTLRRGPLGLLEVLQDVPLSPQANLLVLVDQFEEIFRCHSEGGVDESEAFVALLLESASQRRFPVHVVITMRSDQIGKCGIFANLPEAINESQYLTPRLTREQRRSAIIGPARVFGGDVDPGLVNSLLNDMGSDPNKLPLMQHVLMRMWTQASSRNSGGAPPSVQGEKRASPWPVLTLEDYARAGKLQDALSNHADEAYGELGLEEKKHIAQVLFRALCERAAGEGDIRRPVELGEVAAVANATVDQVKEVVEVFRESTRSFLTPVFGEPLEADTRLDISHECLIKQWVRLNNWVDEESESAKRFSLLVETAREWKRGDAALWRTPNLEVALDWKSRQNPSAIWAARYQMCADDFDLAMEFLDASVSQRREEEAEREAKRERQLLHARRVSWSLAAALLVVGAVYLWYANAYVFEDVTYFKNVVKKNGLPVGIGEELSFGQVQRRAISMKLIRKGSHGPVTTMIAVNSNDQPTPFHRLGTHLQEDFDRDPFRECRYEYVVDEDGNVVYEKAFDKDSSLVWGFVYAPRGVDRSIVRAYLVGADGQIRSRENSAAELIEILYSLDGFETRIRYLDRDGKPQRGLDEAYGRRQEFDSHGRMTKLVSLRSDGITPMVDNAGNAILECQYDASGNLIQQAAYDAAGKATYFNEGYHKATLAYDEVGNQIELSYYDTEAMPTLNRDWIHRVVYTYDEHGNNVAEAYHDTAGNPTLCSRGYAGVKYEYNSLGNMIAQSFLDTEGNLSLCKDGSAIEHMEYDPAGNLTRLAFSDPDSNATTHAAGYASYSAKFDAKGRRIEVSYRSLSGRLVEPSEVGAVGWTSEYDTRGRETRRTLMETGSGLSLDGVRYAGWVQAYDQRGHGTELTLLDNKGKRFVNPAFGFAVRKRQFDADGNQISESYYDKANRKIGISKGYAELRARYDREGEQVEEMYYDSLGRPTECGDGYAGWESVDTTRGREVWVRYLDTRGRRFTDRAGYAGMLSVYNDRKNEIRRTYLDPHDNPVVTSKGYASIVWEYNNRGDITRASYLDSRDKPVMSTDGYAGWQSVYDDRGNEILTTYLDADRQPVATNAGYVTIAQTYDSRGKTTSVSYLDAGGQPMMSREGVAGRRMEYDKRGNEILRTCFGKRGQLVLCKDGYAIKKRIYDRQGNQTYGANAGTDGRPVRSAYGYAIVTNEYDRWGNQTKLSYRNRDSSLWADAGGIAETRFEYDDAGNLRSLAFFGRNGRPVGMSDGYSMWRAEYDSQGNQTRLSYYGVNGKPVIANDAYFELRMKFNARKQIEEASTYDTKEQLVLNKYGWARVTRNYDGAGNLAEVALFGADGKPMIGSDGYASMRMVYDENGNEADVSYFGVRGEPIMYQGVCARWTRKYDALGNIIEQAYFGTDGKLALCWIDNVAIAARWVAQYDATGTLTKKEYFDDRDQLVLEKRGS